MSDPWAAVRLGLHPRNSTFCLQSFSSCLFSGSKFDTKQDAQSACLPFIRSGQNHLARHSERGMKTRQTQEEVGRQHQGMDRPGVRQVLESSGEQRKMRKLVAKSSVVPNDPCGLGIDDDVYDYDNKCHYMDIL